MTADEQATVATLITKILAMESWECENSLMSEVRGAELAEIVDIASTLLASRAPAPQTEETPPAPHVNPDFAECWQSGWRAGFKAHQGLCVAAPQTEETPTEMRIRQYLWLSHGHHMIYGDDGEMQCSECAKFGAWDYKRTPIDQLLDTIQRKNLAQLVASQSGSPGDGATADNPTREQLRQALEFATPRDPLQDGTTL